MNILFIIFSVLYGLQAAGQGFSADTVVKTPQGYSAIRDLKEGDLVICYNFKGECVEQPITHKIQQTYSNYLKITSQNTTLEVAPDQQFYLPLEKGWLKASSLNQKHTLLKSCSDATHIDAVELIEEPIELYDITVKHYHNFCVSKEEILVHNWGIVIPFLTYTFGGEVVFVSLATIAEAAVVGFIGAVLAKAGADVSGSFDFTHKRDRIEQEIHQNVYPIHTRDPKSGNCHIPRIEPTPLVIPSDPMQSIRLPEPLIYTRLTPTKPFNEFTPVVPLDRNIKWHTDVKSRRKSDFKTPNPVPSFSLKPRPTPRPRMTTQEATELARKLGYERTYDHKFNSHNEAVFKKGNTYITQDKDSHKGGVWKLYNRKNERIGSYNHDLTTKVDE